MFEIGDKIVYGSTGVCEVTGIGKLDRKWADPEKEYYTLKPCYECGEIYIPTDSDVYMRKIITKEKAEELIDYIGNVDAEAYMNKNVQELTHHYDEAFESHSCKDLIKLAVSIRNKKQIAESHKKKIGTVDDRYMRRAEELLFGEFAVALGIDRSKVKSYIYKRIGAVA